MVAAIFLARRLDTTSFAAYSYFQLTVSLIAAYAAMGLGVAASRFFAQEHSPSDAAAPLATTVWILSVGLACAAFLVTGIIPDGWIGAGLGVPRSLLAVGVLVLSLQIVPDGAIIGLERYRQAAAIGVLAGSITLGGAALAAAFNKPIWAMGALLAASIFQSSAEAVVVVRAVGLHRFRAGLPLTRAHVKEVLGFSGPMFLVTLMSASAGWVVGRIILTGPRGSHEFALFTIGLQWFALAMFMPGMLSRVMLPVLVRDARDTSSIDVSRRTTRAGVLMTVAAAIGVAAAGTVFGPLVFRLYGERYSREHSLITIFLVAAVLCAPANALGNSILAHDGHWEWFGLTMLWYIILISLAYAIRDQGAWGGGATYTAAYAVFAIGALWAARRRSLV